MSKQITSRINRLSGQLTALKNKLDQEDYDCEEVAIQIKAIIGASKSLGRAFVEEDMQKCQATQMSDADRQKRIQTIINTAFTI